MFSLYVVSILIFLRSIVRVIEYLEGDGGYIISHELFLYLFDAVPMFLAVVTMNWIHPSEVSKHLRQGRNSSQEQKHGEFMQLTERCSDEAV